jgi:succinate dehydrogenase / fumarate reductase cytochrome b subunit
VNTHRPVYLNLFEIRLPVPGLMSIGHRISGVALILALPYLAHLLGQSLSGPAGFAAAAESLDGFVARLALFLMGWGLLHHLLAGIRYLFLDIDLGVEKATARASAWAVLLGAPVLAVVLGVLL